MYSVYGEGLDTIIVKEKNNIENVLRDLYDCEVYFNWVNDEFATIELWQEDDLLEMKAVKCEVY